MIVIDIVEYAKAQGKDMGIEDKIIRNETTLRRRSRNSCPCCRTPPRASPARSHRPASARSPGAPQ
jgi:hypothetical protein